MNIRTSYVLFAVLTAVGTLTVSAAFAQQEACPDCVDESAKTKASERLMSELPISVTTDHSSYSQGDIIMVNGRVANVASGFPVTLSVVSPKNNIITIDQITVGNDGKFSTTLNTGGSLWKYDGTYTIKVQYGTTDKSNKVRVDLSGGLPSTTPTPSKCNPGELNANGHCVPFVIEGGSVTGASINTSDKSILVTISSTQEGTLTLNPSTKIISGIFMVLVDGQEWRDAEINGNKVTVNFPAGTETIEIIGTFVIPEFGAIAALILAVAVISIIAVSARSRLSLMPRL